MSGSRGRVFKGLFGLISLLFLVWFLLVGVLERVESEGNTAATKLSPQVADSMKHMGVDKADVLHAKSDLNYMSKRRVPNGPNPIHNRRTGNSRRPPGHA